jgi:hypothetical protein
MELDYMDMQWFTRPVESCPVYVSLAQLLLREFDACLSHLFFFWVADKCALCLLRGLLCSFYVLLLCFALARWAPSARWCSFSVLRWSPLFCSCSWMLLCYFHIVVLCFPSACCASGVLLGCPLPMVSVLMRSLKFVFSLLQCT